MTRVKFLMFWTSCGLAEFKVPDEICDDADKIFNYLKEHIHEINIPDDSEYVSESDEIDEEFPLTIIDDNGNTKEI